MKAQQLKGPGSIYQGSYLMMTIDPAYIDKNNPQGLDGQWNMCPIEDDYREMFDFVISPEDFLAL